MAATGILLISYNMYQLSTVYLKKCQKHIYYKNLKFNKQHNYMRACKTLMICDVMFPHVPWAGPGLAQQKEGAPYERGPP